MSDFDEFYDSIGKELPIYRECVNCGEIYIVNPETFDKPKTQCDPGYCPFYIPICLCNDGDTLYSYESIEECPYPNCRCGPTKD